MRVTTAFNRMLRLAGAHVRSVSFTDAGIVVGLGQRRRRHRCPCGWSTWARYDRSRRRWRHLDVATHKLWLEADIARIDCARCRRVRTEEVPWARPGARVTREFEQTVAWLAQRADKTTISTLMRCSWATVDGIVQRVVAEEIDDSRLDGLVNIGVDEISYKRGHVYLTIVADHDTGRVVWVAKGRNQAALDSFFGALGEQRCADIKAISMDMATVWRDPVARWIPQADVCFDPFHIIKWANEALDAVYKDTPATIGTGSVDRLWRTTRYALRAGAERLEPNHHTILNRLRRHRYGLWRAWDLKERLRAFFRDVEPTDARPYLKAWITAALRSRLRPIMNLARKIRRHFDGIVATIEHRLSNSRLEGLNSKIRLINRRAHGHRTAQSLAASIYLCLGGITIPLPTQT